MNSPLPSFFSDARLTIIDVGARGGLSWQWAPFKHLITTVLVEPDPAEAAALVEKLKGEGLGGVKVIPKGLGARNGTAELNLLRNPECSSILEPNLPWLARFPESERFTTAKRIPIELSTLDSELAALGVTQCDFLKLDVQGYELEVLAGASAAVRQCLVLEAETSFSEIYKGQPLFAQIDSALRPLGFSLIDLERVW
jgi:FkbM family methyltransferase